MKKTLFALCVALAIHVSVFAQGTVGSILFSNRQIPTPAGDGTTYDIPIWAYGQNGTGGAGSAPEGVAVGLFLPGSSTPFVQNVLRNTTSTQFFASPASQTVDVPGTTAGQTSLLMFRVWENTSLTFDEAKSQGFGIVEVTFTSRPLGGTPAGGSPITPPGMNFSLDSSGLDLPMRIMPEPSAVALGCIGTGLLFLRRRRK